MRADGEHAVGRAAGRYVLYDEIASGGMGSVYLGRLEGPAGFSRTVAIKRLHPHLAKDPEFAAMFMDEARVAARIVHPNVVPTLDIVQWEAQLLVVMEYVHGESLARLWLALQADAGRIPPHVAVSVAADVLHGLHAAHEAKSAAGEPLSVVHRDVSPQNVIVGCDGLARLLDFGVAKATSSIVSTKDGRIKGKLAYMAPEQLLREPVDRRTDVFSASIVLWEALVGKRLFSGANEGDTVTRVLAAPIDPPSAIVDGLPQALDEIVLRGLARAPGDRFATAQNMAIALEAALVPARRTEVGEWVERLAGEALTRRAARLEDVARGASRAPTVRTQELSETAIPTDLLELPQPVITEPERTELAITGPAPPPRVRRRRAAGTILAASVAALVALLVFAVRGAPRQSANRTLPATQATVDPVVPPAIETSSGPLPTSLPAPPPPTAVPRTIGRPPRPTPRSGTPAPRSSCNPPYYFEADGAKHLKLECLR
jgi:serine/threonine-protein kinase